jgi:hypothetical protein
MTGSTGWQQSTFHIAVNVVYISERREIHFWGYQLAFSCVQDDLNTTHVTHFQYQTIPLGFQFPEHIGTINVERTEFRDEI